MTPVDEIGILIEPKTAPLFPQLEKANPSSPQIMDCIVDGFADVICSVDVLVDMTAVQVLFNVAAKHAAFVPLVVLMKPTT
jgi:hypothetical protein